MTESNCIVLYDLEIGTDDFRVASLTWMCIKVGEANEAIFDYC